MVAPVAQPILPHRVCVKHEAFLGKGTLTIPKLEVPVSATTTSTSTRTRHQPRQVRDHPSNSTLTIRLQEPSHTGPEPIMLDQFGIRFRDLSQIILLLVALLDQFFILLFSVRVLFVDVS